MASQKRDIRAFFTSAQRPEALEAVEGVSRNSDNSVDELNDHLDEDHEVAVNLEMDSDMCVSDEEEGQPLLKRMNSLPPRKQRKKARAPPVFPKKWLSNPKYKEWLRYDVQHNTMWCDFCRSNKICGVWAEQGTQNFRKKTLLVHMASNDHARFALARNPAQSTVVKTREKMKKQEARSYKSALRTVYWISSEEIPNCKYPSLLQFQRKQGVKDIIQMNRGKNCKKESPESFHELLHSLSEVFQRKMLNHLNSSPFIGLGIDESTDRSQEKHIAAVVRYVDSNETKIKTSFLKLSVITSGTAPAIVEAVKKILGDFSIPVNKLTGLGIDGASVMASDMNGVLGLLQRENPFLIGIHCINHRLHLAVSKAAKDIKNVNTLSTILSTIYQHVNNSPNRLQKFKNLADVLGAINHDNAPEEGNENIAPSLKYLKFKRIFDIRWLSVGEAVKAVIHNYQPLLILLEEEAANDEPTSMGLLEKLSSYKYVALLHLLGDVVGATNHLCRIFQYRDISFSTLQSQVL
ncbi:zinc finger 862-like [Paramuricea clavata]|uniref:Zinc finger 862-like n=2 Tax=Paramuricea clavata TaxID=317549 RepID=A0A7D9I064_PARCT|nr:zinc finger 862-like [Paramuricea clavata]